MNEKELAKMCNKSTNDCIELAKQLKEVQDRIDKAIEMLCLIEHNLEKYEEFGHLEGMKEYYFDYALEKVYELKEILLDILRGKDNDSK